MSGSALSLFLYLLFVAAYNEKALSHKYVVTKGINIRNALSATIGNSSERLDQKSDKGRD